MNCMKNSDFNEGIRSLLVDRDNNPQWQPATLAEVTDEMIKVRGQHQATCAGHVCCVLSFVFIACIWSFMPPKLFSIKAAYFMMGLFT